MIKVLKELGDGKFEVQIEKDNSGFRECGFEIVHDYIAFEGNEYGVNQNGSVNHNLAFKADIHIPIKAFNEVVLPMLINHKYCQSEHLADRLYEEDDTFWNHSSNKNKYTKPRYKKGDKYPAYSFENTAVIYYDSDKKCSMVAVCLVGEKYFNHVTLEFYNKYIKNKEE